MTRKELIEKLSVLGNDDTTVVDRYDGDDTDIAEVSLDEEAGCIVLEIEQYNP